MALNINTWTCKYCHEGEGCLEPEYRVYRIRCLLCLRSEGMEAAAERNGAYNRVTVTTTVSPHLKSGESRVLEVSKWRLAGAAR